MSDLAQMFATLARRVSDLERRQRGQLMTGKIVEQDAAQGLYRVDLGQGFLTGWLPVESAATGAVKIQADPTVGQTVNIRSESGDLSDATISGSGYADDRPHNQNGEFFLQVGAASIVATPDSVTISMGASSIVLTSAGVAIGAPALSHNGTNVGSTHTHGGVDQGNSNTSTPN